MAWMVKILNMNSLDILYIGCTYILSLFFWYLSILYLRKENGKLLQFTFFVILGFISTNKLNSLTYDINLMYKLVLFLPFLTIIIWSIIKNKPNLQR